MWLYRQKSIIVDYHPVTFGAHKHCGSEDTMVLFCNITLQEHVITGLCDCGYESIKVNYHPAKLGGHKHCGSGDVMILVCHLILQEHVIKRS